MYIYICICSQSDLKPDMQITTSNHQEAAPQPFLFKLQVIVPRSDPKWRSVPCTPTTLKAQAYDPHPPLAPWATPGFGMQHGDMWRISYWELCELAGFSHSQYSKKFTTIHPFRMIVIKVYDSVLFACIPVQVFSLWTSWLFHKWLLNPLTSLGIMSQPL